MTEKLRVTEAELRARNDRLVGGIVEAQAGQARSDERFVEAPDACLETDVHGVILAANAMAGTLLDRSPDRLLGKPLASYVTQEERRAFRVRLSELARADGAVRRWTFGVLDRSGTAREVDARLRSVRPAAGSDQVVWWALTPTDQPPVSLAPERSDDADAAMSSLGGGDAEAVLRQISLLAAALLRAAGVGVMLTDEQGTLRWVTASDARAQAFEHAQAALGQGPCVDALRTAAVVSTPDVASDGRWPDLGRMVAGQGIGGVLCAPLVVGNKPVGSFNVFSSQPLSWTGEDETTVLHFAKMVVLLLQTRVDLHEQQTLASQLQWALHARVTIEQAKGVLIARQGLTSDTAWALLRDTARASHRRVADVAASIVDTGDLPPAGG